MFRKKNISTPFSFDEIKDTESIELPFPSFITSSDGIKLAYYPVRALDPVGAIIFIHGGGACSGAGYQYLANGLAKKYNVSVYLIDIRGHGNSEGTRGDSPTAEQVLKDIKLMVDFVKTENLELPLYLGGHSSGAGLILNYIKSNKGIDIKGYIFISPQFGYKSKTERKNNENPFVRVKIPLFILNGISNGTIFGNTPAVFFNYPEDVLKEQPLLIKSITCNMSIALTPKNPQEQFYDIDKPFGLFIGEEDELFDPQKVIYYADIPNEEIKMRSVSQIVKNVNHLSILNIADELIGETILKINRCDNQT